MTNSTQETPRLFALNVANAFIESTVCTSVQEQNHIRQTAFLVGEHLAAAGYPGDWSKLCVPTLFEEMSEIDPRQQIGIGITLVGIYGWLGGVEWLPLAACRSVLGNIADHVADWDAAAPVYDLARSGQQYLDRLAVLEETEVETAEYQIN